MQSLGKDVDGTDLSPDKEALVKEGQLNSLAKTADVPNAPDHAAVAAAMGGQRKACPKVEKSKPKPGDTGIEKQMGRLVVDEGRSRYVSNSFWSTLTDEVSTLLAFNVFVPVRVPLSPHNLLDSCSFHTYLSTLLTIRRI